MLRKCNDPLFERLPLNRTSPSITNWQSLPTARKIADEIRRLFARLTRRRAPLAEHLRQRPRPFLLTGCGKFVHPRWRGIASSPHGRLRRKKSSMLPDEISVKRSRQHHGAYNRSVTLVRSVVRYKGKMVSEETYSFLILVSINQQ